MTAQGRYAASDSSFGRSTGNAAARGGALIAVAVVIGFLLLWRGGVGGSDDEVTASSTDDAAADSVDDADAADDAAADDSTATDDGSGDDAATDDATGDDAATDDSATTQPEETIPVPVTRPPGEVKVAVANATDTSGLAGARSGELSAFGYVTEAVNAAADTAQSNVYYVEGYGDDAAAVAENLGGTSAVLRPMPDAGLPSLIAESNQAAVDGFHIAVILGTDGVLG